MTMDFRALGYSELWPKLTFHTEETKQVPTLQAAGRKLRGRTSLPWRVCENAVLGFSGPWGMKVKIGEGQPLPCLITRNHFPQGCITTYFQQVRCGAPLACPPKPVPIPSHTLTTSLSLNHIPDQTLFSLFPKLKTNVYICMYSTAL
jgi:hypothetical protein